MGMGACGEVCETGGGVGEEGAVAEDGEAGPEHGCVDAECGTKMGRETVLTNSGMAPWREKVILETRLDHPPADKTLESDAG